MKILIDENTRVAQLDNFNWVIQLYRTKKDKEGNTIGKPDWFNVPNRFFIKPELALEYAINEKLTNQDIDIDLKEFKKWQSKEIKNIIEQIKLRNGVK